MTNVSYFTKKEKCILIWTKTVNSGQCIYVFNDMAIPVVEFSKEGYKIKGAFLSEIEIRFSNLPISKN